MLYNINKQKMQNYSKTLKNQDGSLNIINVILFIIAVIVILAVIYFFGRRIFTQYSNTISTEPWLVETTKSATVQTIIPDKKILRSNDSKYGIEFAYSLWFYVDEWSGESKLKDNNNNPLYHILSKGDNSSNSNQCPGIWLNGVGNDLRILVKMNTFNKSSTCTGEDCYLEKCYIFEYIKYI